jgi:uncharacterized protein (TIGR03435 family)
VDKTGLAGTFDFTVQFVPESYPEGAPPPVPPGEKTAAADGQTELSNIFTAVQEQLGLRLEKKKGPLNVIVIDNVTKTPAEN